MFNFCFCGSFHHQQEEYDLWGPSSGPKISRKTSFRKSNNKKNSNPYSKRGLDKFSSLLAELEERRQKIYAQMNSQDVSFIRFVRSNSDNWVPIVVKLGDHKQDKMKRVYSTDTPMRDHKQDKVKLAFTTADTQVMQNTEEPLMENSPTEFPKQVPLKQQPASLDGKTPKKQKSFTWNLKLDRWRPSYYLPMMLVLILLCLLMFGRSVAILCTSLCWYSVPMLDGGGSNLKRSMKKKNYVRRLSEKKIASDGFSSPNNYNMEAMKGSSSSSPGRQRKGKSW